MTKIKTFAATLFLTFLSISITCASPDASIRWNLKAKYYDYTSNLERSQIEFLLKTSKTDNSQILTQTGHGKYAGFEKASWFITSKVHEENSVFYPLSTQTVIKNPDGAIVAEWSQEFDLTKKIIITTLKNPELKKPATITLPLKGPTVDNNTLILFLEKFSVAVKPNHPMSFYLLTPDANLYKVNLKFAYEDTINIGNRPIKAIKFRLIADMGILDDMFDKFVPPTFVWMIPENNSMKWVRYEGMETGAKSAYVRAQIANQGAISTAP